jgi:hypothetical protein
MRLSSIRVATWRRLGGVSHGKAGGSVIIEHRVKSVMDKDELTEPQKRRVMGNCAVWQFNRPSNSSPGTN